MTTLLSQPVQMKVCLNKLSAAKTDMHEWWLYIHVCLTGGQILVRALLRVPSPGSVFTASHHLLEWAFAQPLLHDIARTWVSDLFCFI